MIRKKIASLALIMVLIIPGLMTKDLCGQVNGEYFKKFYHIKLGNLWFQAIRLNYKDMMAFEIKTDTLRLYNAWDRDITLKFIKLPDFLNATAIPEILQPGQEGKIAVTYDAKIKGEYGPQYDFFYINTNDSITPDKRIIVSPNLKEDFSKLTEKERLNAPKIVFDLDKYDFGECTQGDVIKYNFIFHNDGKSDLIIRKTKSSCGCTATNPEKTLLTSGESSSVGISFNTSGRIGKQQKSITVISNDPDKPETILYVTGTIVAKE